MNEIENRRTIEKIEETKSWLFEEIIKSITSNKTDRQKKKRRQIINIMNEMGYHCRPCRHQRVNKGILQITLHR